MKPRVDGPSGGVIVLAAMVVAAVVALFAPHVLALPVLVVLGLFLLALAVSGRI